MASSLYAKKFDRSSNSFNTNPEYNVVFLHAQKAYANDMLRSRGHVFLNEIYDMLNIPRTTAGATVGWFYGEDDIYIDFGPMVPDENGSIELDFNVLGVILGFLPPY